MDSQNQVKRKHEDQESCSNKKQHSEEEFSKTQISAESTHIDDSVDLSKAADEIVNSHSPDHEEDDSVDESLLNTVVDAHSSSTENTLVLKDIIRSLENEIGRKDTRIDELQHKNRALTAENDSLKNESRDW